VLRRVPLHPSMEHPSHFTSLSASPFPFLPTPRISVRKHGVDICAVGIESGTMGHWHWAAVKNSWTRVVGWAGERGWALEEGADGFADWKLGINALKFINYSVSYLRIIIFGRSEERELRSSYSVINLTNNPNGTNRQKLIGMK
jgi:hypothetical protein